MRGISATGKPVDVDKLLEMYQQGMSLAAIGRQLGHSHSVLGYHLKKRHIPIRGSHTYSTGVPTQELIDAYESGMSLPEIAEQVGITDQAVYSRLINAKVPMRSFKESVQLSYARGRNWGRRGSDSVNWKGGRSLTKDGYIELRIDGKQKPEHRYVWESSYGAIEPGWVVHHLNGQKTDNRIENLQAMPRKSHSPRDVVRPYQQRIRTLESQLAKVKAAWKKDGR